MKQSQIQDLPPLLPSTYENIFNVYTDENNMYYYNLLECVLIPELPVNYFNTYTITPKDSWPMISYKVHGTTALWWLVMQLNNIINPTLPLQTGQILRVLKNDYVSSIVSSLN